ncbi:hypothetical protein SNOUR_36350 [Streptomyces noursei ATCC 11455]|nr:hypothetical protein SNOUR_36350 [Streptomyces noursei ATCC 11455]
MCLWWGRSHRWISVTVPLVCHGVRLRRRQPWPYPKDSEFHTCIKKERTSLAISSTDWAMNSFPW